MPATTVNPSTTSTSTTTTTTSTTETPVTTTPSPEERIKFLRTFIGEQNTKIDIQENIINDPKSTINEILIALDKLETYYNDLKPLTEELAELTAKEKKPSASATDVERRSWYCGTTDNLQMCWPPYPPFNNGKSTQLFPLPYSPTA